jgi:hypothetical protein
LIALLLVKEDMGFFLAGIGMCLLLTKTIQVPRQKLLAVILIVGGVIYSVAAVYYFIPAMGGKADYYWEYKSLGPNAPSALKHILGAPVYALKQLITPRVKLHTELELFAPFLFVSLLSPYTLPALPLILERFLASGQPNWWTNTFHYNAYLVVPIAFGAVGGAIRLDGWITWGWRSTTRRGSKARAAGDWLIGKVAPALTACFLATAIAFVPFFAFKQLFQPSFYHRGQAATAEAAAAAYVPSGVVVETTGNVGPYLLTRDTVEVWDGYGDTPRTAPWIIANDTSVQFGWFTTQDEAERVAWLRKLGYVTVFTDDGYIVMHAPNVKYTPPASTG